MDLDTLIADLTRLRKGYGNVPVRLEPHGREPEDFSAVEIQIPRLSDADVDRFIVSFVEEYS